VVAIDDGVLELSQILRAHNAFAATVLDGVVMNSVRIADQTGIQVLGPGDVLLERGEPMPPWLGDVQSRAAGSVRLGLFGNDLLAAALRWPRLIQGLYGSVGDQMQRLTAQLVICQLPRVDDRVLAMLWLLSESWGQVTPSGVRLPLALTHETVGALVGARRPTVTLALRKLVQDGALIHQDSGWLLLEPPPEPAGPESGIPPPVFAEVPSRWAQAQDPGVAYAELRETIRRLREEHVTRRQAVRDRLERMRRDSIRLLAARQLFTAQEVTRRPPPSS
jgi:hypothetical protein